MSSSRRLQIQHRTGFRYSDNVDVSFNEARMTPHNGSGQVLLSHQLSISPNARVQGYTDYWGAWVESFEVHIGHRMLEITSTSVVDTATQGRREIESSWDPLRAQGAIVEMGEFLDFTEYVDAALLDADVSDLLSSLRSAPSPEAAVTACISAVRDQLRYEPGRTSVSTTASQAWAAGHGVCQDFSHVTLALLRAAGIPSRYVSGYLHVEESCVGRTVVGESHAWIEYWDGAWHACDPTNNRGVGSAHVVVARGRDYADVPPLKGIFAGGSSEGLGVTVEITQLS